MANDDEAPVQFVREGMRQRVRVKSLIGKHLNERLVRSMMLITIILMCGFPLLTYDEVNSAPQLGFSMLVEAPTHSAELFEQMLFACEQRASYPQPSSFTLHASTIHPFTLHRQAAE